MLALLERAAVDVAPGWELVALDVFAVQFRYSIHEDPGEPLDREGITAALAALVDAVSRLS
ncbi:MAG: hypothetical protein EXR72_03340 [Myxococcales bacterium]|nr:hypothetical protein [Myxococcales bacterium]